eukprot:CAMPEP_0119559278 /NCGR_PEP_ID=MMETSP1352-20130426/12317_1 /TAXON_ID=265584 /ORGANISM="Stauroneis constricta, Strain CCMP1120" /LENGTH=280 /DNA_ID=CAMNT_0007606933 /DNA_START=38 /DNA_END=880 /DNA_ORIENTATION=+
MKFAANIIAAMALFASSASSAEESNTPRQRIARASRNARAGNSPTRRALDKKGDEGSAAKKSGMGGDCTFVTYLPPVSEFAVSGGAEIVEITNGLPFGGEGPFGFSESFFICSSSRCVLSAFLTGGEFFEGSAIPGGLGTALAIGKCNDMKSTFKFSFINFSIVDIIEMFEATGNEGDDDRRDRKLTASPSLLQELGEVPIAEIACPAAGQTASLDCSSSGSPGETELSVEIAAPTGQASEPCGEESRLGDVETLTVGGKAFVFLVANNTQIDCTLTCTM